MSKKDGKNKKVDKRDAVTKRLDAIIRLYLENYRIANKDFTEKDAAVLLNSSGLTPTEIALVLGKKSKDAISPYLYSKESGKQNRKKRKER
jgi:hypothetical protein